MTTDPPPHTDEFDSVTVRELDDLIEELARLSRSELPPTAFYREVLGHTLSGLAAAGGAIWIRSADGSLEIGYQANLGEARSAPEQEAIHCHRQWAELAAKEGEPRLVPPHAGRTGEVWNPTSLILALSPFHSEGPSAGVIEVLFQPGSSPKVQQGYLQFLEVVGELIVDFSTRRQYRQFREQSSRLALFEQFSERVHRSLDLHDTVSQIVNEGRRFIGCDRVSVLVCEGRKCRLLAVSSVDAFSRRANLVRRLESLCQEVAPTGEPLWYSGNTDDLAPKAEHLLHDYLDESHARSVALIPLRKFVSHDDKEQGRTLGMLVVEQFQGVLDDAGRQTISVARGHAATALSNALEMQKIPFNRLLRWAAQVKGLLPKSLLAAGLVTVAVAVLALVPADFQVEARGKLQPVHVRDVFAPNDGVVAEVRTRHGQEVREGQILVVLRKPELDLEFKRIWGELQTARKRLASVEADRLQDSQDSEEQRRRNSHLTAQHEELREMIANLLEQDTIVRRQQAQLEVRSPVSGAVLTWSLEQLLDARPVVRGQALMTVANLAGAWRLELRVPDDQIAHVLSARGPTAAELDVTFVLATDPGVKLQGKLMQIALRTEVGETEQPFVLAYVDVDRNTLPQLVPGATVAARVACGRRSLGYVWLHSLIDAMRTWMLF